MKTWRNSVINRLRDFLENEIKSKEQSFSFSQTNKFEITKQMFVKSPKQEFSSTDELVTAV